MILVILIFLVLLCFVKISNNNDIIDAKCETVEDQANVKNAKKVFSRARYSIIMLIISIFFILLIIICQFTNLDTIVINYFSVDIYQADFFNANYYYIPIFLLISRQILLEVKLSEFLHKYFEVKEEEISTKEVIHNLLYKPKEPDPNEMNKITPPKPEPETKVEENKPTEEVKPVEDNKPTEETETTTENKPTEETKTPEEQK